MPIPVALAAAGLQAAGSIAGGVLSNKGAGRQSKMEKTKQSLVDQLLSSLNGQGPYSDLFNNDAEAFQKSFVDPAKSLFKNQIAPQIQQSYIANGQQGNTSLDDHLTRAGVDLDQLLNSQMYQFNQDSQNRKFNTIQGILGQGNGTPPGFSGGQALAQGTAGYLSGDAFQNSVKDIFSPQPQQQAPNPFRDQPRNGFSQDWRQWKDAGIGDPRWAGGN